MYMFWSSGLEELNTVHQQVRTQFFLLFILGLRDLAYAMILALPEK